MTGIYSPHKIKNKQTCEKQLKGEGNEKAGRNGHGHFSDVALVSALNYL